MREIQQFITRFTEHNFLGHVSKKSFRVEVLEFTAEKYSVRDAVLQIFAGDESEKIDLGGDAVSGKCGEIYFQLEITPPPNYRKTIDAIFWTAKN